MACGDQIGRDIGQLQQVPCFCAEWCPVLDGLCRSGLVVTCVICGTRLSLSDKYDPVKKRYFPPPLDLLLSWTTLFRSGGTLRNYLGYVQTACIMFDKPTQVVLFGRVGWLCFRLAL